MESINQAIQEQLNQLLSDHQLSTVEKAKVVADQLLRRGVQPTWRNIRDIIGTGSASTLQKVVNDYWQTLGQRLDHLEQRKAIPEVLLNSVNALWDQALEQANETMQAALEKGMAQAKAIEQAAEENIKHITEQAEQLKKEKHIIEQRWDTLNQEFQQQQEHWQTKQTEAKQAYDTLQQDYDQLNTHHIRIESELAQTQQRLIDDKSQYEQQLALQKEQQEQAIKRQTEQYESMLQHYANEVGQAKVALEQAEKQHYNERQTLLTKQESINQQFSQTQINLATKTLECERLQNQEQRLNNDLSHANHQLRDIEKQLSRIEAKNEWYQEQISELKNQLQEKEKQLHQQNILSSHQDHTPNKNRE
jgi:chromosome segregation ATPase